MACSPAGGRGLPDPYSSASGLGEFDHISQIERKLSLTSGEVLRELPVWDGGDGGMAGAWQGQQQVERRGCVPIEAKAGGSGSIWFV